MVASKAAEAFPESMTWGSDAELEAMESEQTGLLLSLPLSPCGFAGGIGQ